MAKNPLRLDPTRTTVLRQRALGDMNKRFRALRGAIRQLVLVEDAFGLKAKNKPGAPAAPGSSIPLDAVLEDRDFAEGGPAQPAAPTRPPKKTALDGVLEDRDFSANVGSTWHSVPIDSVFEDKDYTGVVPKKEGKRPPMPRVLLPGVRKRGLDSVLEEKDFRTGFVVNARWKFETDDGKVAAYREWLARQVSAGVLETTADGKPWLHQYIQPAYKKGMVRAYEDTKRIAGADNLPFIDGGKKAFLDMAFAGPVGQGKLRTLATRQFTLLQGVTAEMDKQMSIVLADSLAAGHGADKVAARLAKEVDNLEKKRARTIARTELVHAHAEGQLDSFEVMNVEEVGVMAEWATAEDAHVCTLCAPLHGAVLTISEARGLLPRHPNCRCAWIPADVGEHIGGSTAGQTHSKENLEHKLRASVKAEHPKLGAVQARKASRWLGADLKVTGKLKPGSKAHKAAQAKAARTKAKAVATKKAAAEKAAAAKQALHSQKVKVGLAKKKYGIADDELFLPGDGPIPSFSSTGVQAYAEKRGVELTGPELLEVLGAKAPPGVPNLVAQAATLDKFVQAKVAVNVAKAKTSKEATDAAAAWSKSKKFAGPAVDSLDAGDYSKLPGWAPPTGDKTQSYGVILFNDEGQVLMRKPTKGFGGVEWTFAKGGGTKPATTALAELGEETGHTAHLHGLLEKGYKGDKTKTNYFLGKSTGFDAGLMDTETAATQWMSFDEALEAIAKGKSAKAVARDTDVLLDAYAAAKAGADGLDSNIIHLASTGSKAVEAAKETAAKAAHAHKVKLGMAKKNITKPKYGGIEPHAPGSPDWAPMAVPKLSEQGANKALATKGWHTTTLPKETADALAVADDVVAQKEIIDKLKKAPKGTPPSPVAAPVAREVVEDPATVFVPPAYQTHDGLLNIDGIKFFSKTDSLLKIPEDVADAVSAAPTAAEQVVVLRYWRKTGKAPPAKVVPAPTSSAIAVPAEGALTKVRDLPGSTRPWLAKDTTGKQWVVKDVGGSGIDPDHLRSEALADELYRQIGLDVPAGTVVDTPSGPRKITEFLEGGQTLGEWRQGKSAKAIAEMNEQLRKGFVADALLANHDVAGLSNDNILIVGGKALRIDNGGALTYRAQGGAKGTWGTKVQELVSMRDPKINRNTAAIYEGITDEEIHAQIRTIVARRDNILAAVPDDAVRATLAARIDDLQAQLPAKPAKAATGTGGRRAAYGVDDALPTRVSAAKSNGVNLAGDRDLIEDNNLLVWPEQTPNGEVTVLQFKVTQKGSQAIEEALGEDFLAAKRAAAAPTARADSHHPEDFQWNNILAGIKTVNHHAADKAYNQGSLQSMELAKKALTEDLKNATGELKEMTEHNLAVIAQVEKAKAAGTTTPPLARWVRTAKESEAAPRPRRRAIRVDRDGEFKLRTATFKNGEATVDPTGRNRFRTDEAYRMDVGDGITVNYIPNDGTYHGSAGRALHGTFRMEVPEGVSETSIQRAMGVLKDMGIDASPPSEAYEEALYLHRGVYLRGKHNDPTYLDIWQNAALTDEERVDQLKGWIKQKMKVDVNKRAGYDPQGVAKHADGSGFRYWNRWDLSPEEVEEKFADLTIYHSSGSLSDTPRGRTASTLDAILNSGGEFTTTTGRVRKGVDIGATGGASSHADIESGGASYFFTRVKEVKASGNGFFFRTGLLSRQDAISYTGDNYGRISNISNRVSTEGKYRQLAGYHSNETIFKEGLSIDDIDFLRVRDKEEREEVLAVFKKHGMTALPDGRAVGDIVVAGRTAVPKQRRIGR